MRRLLPNRENVHICLCGFVVRLSFSARRLLFSFSLADTPAAGRVFHHICSVFIRTVRSYSVPDLSLLLLSRFVFVFAANAFAEQIVCRYISLAATLFRSYAVCVSYWCSHYSIRICRVWRFGHVSHLFLSILCVHHHFFLILRVLPISSHAYSRTQWLCATDFFGRIAFGERARLWFGLCTIPR